MQFREVEPVIKSTFFEICVNRAATNVDLCLPGKLYMMQKLVHFSSHNFSISRDAEKCPRLINNNNKYVPSMVCLQFTFVYISVQLLRLLSK